MPVYDFELDTCGLMCPLPLLRLKKVLQTMQTEQIVRVTATDPASRLDFGVFIEQAGHALLKTEQEEGIIIFLIRKGGND